ncbi:hypothetical protein [Castellaniella sp.]|uniref:hypothetical protein n=1 Tax=Castellaniella sp. TaxID=1955812 RepID=UPI0035632AA6
MLGFTAADADLLGRTADALTAWMGKPVIAEIITETEAGYEWALFAIPLQPGEAPEAPVQVGGPGAHFAGSCGGLDLTDGQMIECTLLWAIQRCDYSEIRYIKVSAQGEETGWSDNLASLLPFAVAEPETEPETPEDPDDADDLA